MTVKDEPNETTSTDLPAQPALPLLPALPAEEPPSEPQEKKPRLAPDTPESPQAPDTTKSPLETLFGDVFVTRVEPAKSMEQLVGTELENYQNEPTVSVNDDPLQWWKHRTGTYPILSKLACAYLVIPATSVASERVFSTAGDIVSAQRGTLGSENVDLLIFLKKNMQLSDLK